jgi:putative transport protein
MTLFGGAIQITGITFQLFVVFLVIVAGYLIGRIEIKGVSIGAAGVFIAALIFGGLFSGVIHHTMTLSGDDITTSSFAIIENTGLILFVGAVGMMAGPSFFRNLKKNYKSYLLLGIIIIAGGVLTSVACYYLALQTIHVPADISKLGVTKNEYAISMITGIMSGSLTSTPAFSAAQATASTIVPTAAQNAIQDVVTIGHAIAYIFGVIGVVLFVQLIPRFLNADMEKERKLITIVDTGENAGGETAGGGKTKKRFVIDAGGFAAFGLVVVIGIFIGMIKVPLSSAGLSGTTFSLTTTGGVLIAGLVLGHFGHIGPISLEIGNDVLRVFREFGLIVFLIGAGIPGGASFVKYFQSVYFVYGVVITIVPMVIGYFVAKKLLKLPLLNSLGSITGGMTSTPALGALIKAAGTDDVASSYASVYPIALVCVVLSSQFMLLIFG